MYPLANNLSSYTINLMDIGFWSCCCSPADLRAEAEEIVTLKRQLRMLPNLERNHTGLHLEHRVFIIHFLEFVDKGQRTTFFTVRLGKTWNRVKSATKAQEYISKGTELKLHKTRGDT